VSAWVDFGNMTGRNQDAIKKTMAGMLKLSFLSAMGVERDHRLSAAAFGALRVIPFVGEKMAERAEEVRTEFSLARIH